MPMNMQSTLGERLHEIIRQEIFAGKYKPGERLFYESIARDTGVSMTPIKEAFMLLEKEGLVVTLARKGTFVRELSEKDLTEFSQIRLALESLSVDLICRNGLAAEDETEFEAICDSLEKHIRMEDAKACVLDDIHYHKQLVIASGNSQLVKMIDTLPLTNLFNLVEKAPYYLRHGEFFLAEHRKMLRLLNKRDAARVKEVLGKHITTGPFSIFVAMHNGS